MFRTLTTLMTGANARAETRVRDTFALELIEEKIRQAEAGLKSAKATLASLIQRQRVETRAREALDVRIADMLARAKEALDGGREDLARDAAQAIAEMENELATRKETLNRLDSRVLRLRSSVEAGHRRIVDLKQGAIQARAVRRESQMQVRLGRSLDATPVEEAEALIKRVLGEDDPFERSEILREIEGDLTNKSTADRLSDAGFGPATRSTADAVLERLKSTKKS